MVESSKAQLLQFLDLSEKYTDMDEFLTDFQPDEACISSMHNCLESHMNTINDGRYIEVLFKLHKSGSHRCRLFVIQFIPSLIGIYFNLMDKLSRPAQSMLDTFLLAIYTSESSEQTDSSFRTSYRIPSLSNTSVYHEPCSTPSQTLTEGALSRHEQSSRPIVLCNSSKRVDTLSVRSRLIYFKTALQLYNRNISSFCESSYISFCKMVIRFSFSGIPYVNDLNDSVSKAFPELEFELHRHKSRLKVSPDLLHEMVIGIHYIMYDGYSQIASVAVEFLDQLVKYCLNAPLNMALCSIMNSIQTGNRNEKDVAMLNSPNNFVARENKSGRRYAFSGSIGPAAGSYNEKSKELVKSIGIQDDYLKKDHLPSEDRDSSSTLDQRQITLMSEETNVDLSGKLQIKNNLTVDNKFDTTLDSRRSSDTKMETAL